MLDWFTPTNHFALDKGDIDLDSSGATLIPGTHLVLGGGKEGVLYTLDTQNLGHLGDEHAIQHFRATASHLHSLVYWKSAKNGNMLYVWGQRDKAKVYKLEGRQDCREAVDDAGYPERRASRRDVVAFREWEQGRYFVGSNPCDGRLMARVAARGSPCLQRG